MPHPEMHRTSHIGWIRPAVLGANDGLISTSSLVVGVAAADPAPGAVLIAGMSGLVAGALSMAAGEYVSVSSQADTENADFQAKQAGDARVRTVMAKVAVDEAEHARTSLALAEALRPRLTVAQRRRVREAQEKTVQAMVQEELPDAAARQLGLMDGRQLKRTAERVLGCVRP